MIQFENFQKDTITVFYTISINRTVTTYTDKYGVIRVISTPIEEIRFKTEEEAHKYASEHELKENEYDIERWMI